MSGRNPEFRLGPTAQSAAADTLTMRWSALRRFYAFVSSNLTSHYPNQQGGWSPKGGLLLQVKCSEQDVDCGPATVGLKSDANAALLALKEAASVLAVPEGKIVAIDKHVGVSFAGSVADARTLSDSMRIECQKHRSNYDAPLSIGGLATFLGNQIYAATRSSDRLPYKVGLLMAGYDHLGPHIYQACSPTGDTLECKAMAIGDHSQSARTYLEEHLDEFKLCNLVELVQHGLRALRSCLPAGDKLTTANVSIAIVGQSHDFTIYEDNSVAPYSAMQSPSAAVSHHIEAYSEVIRE
nr:proteasome subunit alpha type-1-like [Rhipicephalus microplus]